MPIDETGPVARIRMSGRDRQANQRLLSQLMSGRTVRLHQLDEPARIARRLLDFGLDSDVGLLWGDDADASRAYRNLVRASRSPSVRSLELGVAAAPAVGSLSRAGGSPLGTACLIAPNVIMTATSVLESPEASSGVVFTVSEAGAPTVGLEPAQFFYAPGELGFTVCAVSPAPPGEAPLPAPLRIADQAGPVIGERVTVAYAPAPGNVLLSPGTLELRMGRFVQVLIGDEPRLQPDTKQAPAQLPVRGAPVFDVHWRLAGVIRDVADGVGEMVDVAEIRRELERVGKHYGRPASQVIDAVLTPTAATSPIAETESTPASSDVIVPIRLRLSIVADAAGQPPRPVEPTTEATTSEPTGAIGPLPELPSAGIDLDATDGPDAVPGWVNEGALGKQGAEHLARATEQFGGDWDQSRLWYWSTRLLLEARRRRRLQDIPGLSYLAAGFLDPHREATNVGHFGLIAYTEDNVDSAPRAARTTLLPPLEIDGWKFPVVVRPVHLQLQRPAIMPAAGWASCWARTRVDTGQPVGPGILTAKHVVEGIAVGQQVALDDGSTGQLIDVAPSAVDVALIKTSEDPPPGATRLSMTPYIAPLVPVTMQLRGRNQPSRVVDVNDTFKFFRSADLPLRVGLEHAGLPGDSGGLVTTDGDVAIGIYVARLVNDLDQRLGLAQHIAQAAAVMKGMEVLC